MFAIVTVLQSLSTTAAPSCAGCDHNSRKVPSAVLLNVTDPSVIAALQPALVSAWGRMVPMRIRFMFVRAVVSESARAAFPFSKTWKIYLPQTSWESLSLSFFNSYPQKTCTIWFFHLPSVWFLLISPPSCQLLLQFLWCCSSRCSAACADSRKTEFTRLMIYERCAMAPQRSGSCAFLLTAVCTQSCIRASGRERNFPDESLEKHKCSWKKSYESWMKHYSRSLTAV